jgi:Cysteine-rich CPXCG
MTEAVSAYCPYCGEAVELSVDEGGGSRQAYVEDCPVCCRPWQVEITRDHDGNWAANLRTDND